MYHESWELPDPYPTRKSSMVDLLSHTFRSNRPSVENPGDDAKRPKLLPWSAEDWHQYLTLGCPHTKSHIVFKRAKNRSREKLYYYACENCGIRTTHWHVPRTGKGAAFLTSEERRYLELRYAPEERSPGKTAAYAHDHEDLTSRPAFMERYDRYLESALWRDFRGEVLTRTQHFGCAFCWARKRGVVPAIHLHHLTYERVGKEQLGDVVPLCRECHDWTLDRGKSRLPEQRCVGELFWKTVSVGVAD